MVNRDSTKRKQISHLAVISWHPSVKQIYTTALSEYNMLFILIVHIHFDDADYRLRSSCCRTFSLYETRNSRNSIKVWSVSTNTFLSKRHDEMHRFYEYLQHFELLVWGYRIYVTFIKIILPRLIINFNSSLLIPFSQKHTWEASSLAAGTVLQMAIQVATGELENGLALVRPPGHHAMYDEACGYCFFGNVAVAAANLLDSPPLSVFNSQPPCTETVSFDQLAHVPRFKRILILDWDVHQGQGTQYTFYNDNR